MPRVEQTYFLVRLIEELAGPIFLPGDRLIYTGQSRLDWIDPVFEKDAGAVAEITAMDYQRADKEPDFDPWDNHYHYAVRGWESHGTLDTTELLCLFDAPRFFPALKTAADKIRLLIEEPSIKLFAAYAGWACRLRSRLRKRERNDKSRNQRCQYELSRRPGFFSYPSKATAPTGTGEDLHPSHVLDGKW
jgi:hypothetical protein